MYTSSIFLMILLCSFIYLFFPKLPKRVWWFSLLHFSQIFRFMSIVEILPNRQCHSQMRLTCWYHILDRQCQIHLSHLQDDVECHWMRKKVQCMKSVQIRSFFRSVFSCIRTRKNSVFGHFSSSGLGSDLIANRCCMQI